MPNRKGARNAYYFFVLEKLPELRRRGLAVGGVPEAIPLCSGDWALLTEEQKEKYAEMARQWKAEKARVAAEKASRPVPASLPTQAQERVPTNFTSPLQKCDQVMLETSFYFLNILSHGMLPPHCNQRFLPCEIGCVKYSLQKGIIADFHRFINPGVVPRGFRFHCQAASNYLPRKLESDPYIFSDATHKIPLSGFDFATADPSVVLHELYTFIQPRWGTWPPVYCKSDDQFRVRWCLKHMAKEAGAVNNLEILNVEDLIIELYYQKLQKEPSKSWVCNTLDAAMWDYSTNTRCQWHEENDVLFCALATCKKIAYCISSSLADMFGIQLTASHLPLHESNSKKTVNPKMVVLDAGRFQKITTECTGNYRYITPPNQDQGTGRPAGVKTMYEPATRCGRGIARFFGSISNQSSS
ncbi:protein maelstrom homolog isoform X2 [Sceloporus undulatus]|uniref:protein maelstrom homolog isoform X2 n=1 Tax=Sceloporus undulatus TaxID=8520 RepID=UPI001C4CD539|nr:protein maelstrom homolog isoform X2 [Sceloporus undulatus]